MVTAKESRGNEDFDQSDIALADYMRRIDAGEVVDREDFISNYPDAAADLREYFESVDDLARMAGPVLASTFNYGRSTSDTQVSGVGDSVPDPAPARPDVRPLPKKFGRYRVEKRLGAGAMGAVYLAHDTKLDRPVALKTPAFDAAADADLIERFYREAKSAANLRHAGICPVFDVGEIDGIHFISMAYIEGQPLSAVIKSRQTLPLALAVSVVRKIAVALRHAHKAGVIHRDLKPANIMIDGQGEPLVMDFGLARRVDTEEQTQITLDGMIIGTPSYMSPEQVEGRQEQIGPACDIYSLGVILFELVTGRRPFQGTVAAVIGQVMTQNAPPPSRYCEDTDPELDAICAKMMARKAADRFADMKEVARALSAYLKRTVDEETGIHDLETAHEGNVVSPDPDDASTVLTAAPPPTSGRGKLIGGLAAFASVAVLAAFILVRTLYGTLQIEVLDPDVTVLVDDQKIELTDNKWSGWKRARKHGLEVRIGKQTLALGNTTLCSINGEEQLIRLNVEGVTLVDDSFEIIRNGTTALTIKLEKVPTYPADVTGDTRSSKMLTSTAIGGDWSEPVNLGPVVNSEAHESQPFLSPDGLSLWFCSDREGGMGGQDLWMCVRSSTIESWSRPVNVGPEINTEHVESNPCVSADGLTLLFVSDRAGGFGRHDIWMSTRETVDDAWSEPVNMGPNINSKNIDAAPELSSDGLTLMFSTWVSVRRGTEIWMSTRASTDKPWSQRRSLTINGDGMNCSGPCLSADGHTLLFHSHPLERENWEDVDIWMSKRSSDGQWSRRVKLGFRGDSIPRASGPTLSADGRTLVFESVHPAATGDKDLWMSTRLDPPLAVAPFEEPVAKGHQEAWADYLGLPVEKEVELPDGEKMTFMLIPPGEFMMGSAPKEQARALEEVRAFKESWAFTRIPSEGPQHRVRITKPFYLGKYEVTQAQWHAVAGSNPSNLNGFPTHPVKMVSWDEIQPFLAKLNENSSDEKVVFSLPTEAQWEYACRAGTTTPYYIEESAADFDQLGWFIGNSGGKTHPVGDLKPNAFGIYDMHGNVWEWCADRFTQDYYARTPEDDPAGPYVGSPRVNRGGGWSNSQTCGRSAFRSQNQPYYRHESLGFRLAMTIDSSKSEPTDRTATDRISNYALRFDGIDDFIKTPLTYDGMHPITIEAYIIPERLRGREGIVSNAELRGLGLYRDNDCWRASCYSAESEGAPRISSSGQSEVGRRFHVAVTYDLKKLTLFVEGQSVGSVNLKGRHLASSLPFFIGADANAGEGTHHFCGVIDGVHISNGVRYTENFKPETEFESDDDTMALYHFDEGTGSELRDASPNGNHAKISGATWVHADRSAPVVVPTNGLRFAGNSSHVRVPSLKYDGSHPLTIESIVTPKSQKHTNVVSSFNFGGYNLGVDQEGRWVGRIYGREKPVLAAIDPLVPGRRTHLALVYDGQQASFFVDGQLQAREESVGRYRPPTDNADLFIGADAHNDTGEAAGFFVGDIHQVRFSRSVIYSKNFAVPEKLTGNDDTLALYRFDEGAGTIAHDSSGHDHHGSIQNAQWIRAANTEPSFSNVADPDRRAAEWVRSINNHHFTWITIRQNGVERKIGHEELKSDSALPTEPFQLTSVFLQYNRDLTAEGLVNLRNCQHLKLLNFTYTTLGDAGLVHLQACCPNLQELHLPGGVTDAGLANFGECRELRRLTLHATHADTKGLENFRHCKKLTSLALLGTNLTGDSLESFAGCKELETLNLVNTGVDAAELVHFKECTKLRKLELSGNPAITSKELGYFRNCPELTSVNVARTQVDDEGLNFLIDCGRLTYLDVDETNVSPAFLESFKAQKPNCRVVGTPNPQAVAEPPTNEVEQATKAIRAIAGVAAETPLYTEKHFQTIQRVNSATGDTRVDALKELTDLQWPADRFQRDRIPQEALTAAGWGSASKAPAEIVALLGDPRLNCWSVIYDMTLTDEGKTAVVAHQDGSVSFHDVTNGQLLRILKCHDEIITAVDVSHDGKILATGCVDGSAAFWNRETGAQIAAYTNQADWISEIRFSLDDSLFAMSSRAGDVCVYDSQNPKPLLQTIQHDGRRVEDVAFIDNKRLVTASDDTTLRVWDARTGMLEENVAGHTGQLRALEFSPDSGVLASLDTAGKLMLHDTSNWQAIRTLPTTVNSIPFFSMSRNGKAIVVRETKEKLGLWDVSSGKQTKTWNAPSELATIYAICVDPSGQFVVSGNREARIRIRDFDADVDRFPNPDRLLNPKASLSDDGTQLVLQDRSLHLQAWNLNTLTMRRVQATRTGMVCSDVSSDGSMLVTAGTTWRPRLFDIKSGKLMSHTNRAHTNIVHAVVFSHDDSMIASGASDERLWLWDRKTMNGTEVDCSQFTRIRSLAFSPDDQLIAVGDKNGALQIRSTSDGSLVESFDGKVGESVTVAFTPDGKQVVQGTGDGVIKVWDLSSKKLAFELKDHDQLILSLKFSRDGSTMASSSYDGSIILWDPQTWQPKRKITLYPYGFGHVYLAGFTPEGRHLIVTARNGMAYVLRLTRDVNNNANPEADTAKVYPVPGGATALAASSDGRQVAVITGGVPYRILTRDIRSGAAISEFPLPGEGGAWIRHLSYSPDGKSLRTCAGTHWSVIDATTGEESLAMDFPSTPQIAVFPNRPLVLALYHEREVHRTKRNEVPQRIRIWNWKTGETIYDEIYAFNGSPNDFPSISIDEKHFSYAQEHNHIRCPLTIDGDKVSFDAPVEMEQTSRVRGPLVHSPDGRYAATNVKNAEYMAAVLDAKTGRFVCRIDPESAAASNEGHRYGCNLVFTADSSKLVTADHAGRVRIWSLPSGEKIQSLEEFQKSGNHDPPEIAVTSDGNVIVAGGSADPRMTIQQLERR